VRFSLPNYILASLHPTSVGRFLLGILTDLYKWFSDETLYEQDNRTKIGGKIHYLPGFQQSWSPKFPVEKAFLLTWQNFQQVLRKWHRKLFKVSVLQSTTTGLIRLSIVTG
jgi:THO complex subunit 2